MFYNAVLILFDINNLKTNFDCWFKQFYDTYKNCKLSGRYLVYKRKRLIRTACNDLDHGSDINEAWC